MLKITKYEKLYGIVEGFFSAPLPMWSWKDRYTILESMSSSKLLNTYLYCPKDDPLVSTQWYKMYSSRQEKQFKQFIDACRTKGVQFIYGLNPAMSSSKLSAKKFNGYIDKISAKIEQLSQLGANRFCILYDDIPYAYNALLRTASDESRQYAQLQAQVLNTLISRFSEKKFIFCSSEYFSQKDNIYLEELRATLSPAIDLIWTGNSVFTRRVTKSMLIKAKQLVGNRNLILWNNYPVNDPLVKGLVNLGGFNPPESSCIDELTGILINPLREAKVSVPNLETFRDYLTTPTQYRRLNSCLKRISDVSGLSISQVAPIVECSNVSAIDTKLKYFYKSLSEGKTERIIASINTTLEDWKRTNEFLQSIPRVQFDLMFMKTLLKEKYITESKFSKFDVFPIPIDFVYFDRFLIILLTRFLLLQTKEDIRKMSGIVNEIRNSRIVKVTTGYTMLDNLIALYNSYRGVNRKLLPPQIKKTYQTEMSKAVRIERDLFVKKMRTVSLIKLPLYVSLRKNINQYSIKMVLREASKIKPF